MSKYFYIGFDQEYFKYCYKQVKKKDNYYFWDSTVGNGLLGKLQKFFCCERINKYFEVPMKYVWMNDYKNMINNKNAEKICFVFSKSQSWLLQYNNGIYISRLRKKYQNCKILLYLGDLVSSYAKFDPGFFGDKCDYVISYDEKDCEKYGFVYCPLPYAADNEKNDIQKTIYDVFFCGRAKNRLDDIYKMYDYLVLHGFSCIFYISGVSKKQKTRKGIVYNRLLNYRDYLSILKKSRCILEVIQQDSVGGTLRVQEALAYGKILISNNLAIKDRYDCNQVYVYKNPEEIDLDSLKNNLNREFKKKSFSQLFDKIETLCEG